MCEEHKRFYAKQFPDLRFMKLEVSDDAIQRVSTP